LVLYLFLFWIFFFGF